MFKEIYIVVLFAAALKQGSSTTGDAAVVTTGTEPTLVQQLTDKLKLDFFNLTPDQRKNMVEKLEPIVDAIPESIMLPETKKDIRTALDLFKDDSGKMGPTMEPLAKRVKMLSDDQIQKIVPSTGDTFNREETNKKVVELLRNGCKEIMKTVGGYVNTAVEELYKYVDKEIKLIPA